MVEMRSSQVLHFYAVTKKKFPRELIKISHHRNSLSTKTKLLPGAISYYHEPLVWNENCNKRFLLAGYCYFIWKKGYFLYNTLPQPIFVRRYLLGIYIYCIYSI